jgi:hypothetical protein
VNVKEALIATKEILMTRGRGRLDLINGKGCTCLLGAVGLAAGVDESDLVLGKYEAFYDGGIAVPVVSALLGSLPDDFSAQDPYDQDYTDVYAFNDSNLSDQPVFDLIDRAIEAAE